jgi:hypothetical protein
MALATKPGSPSDTHDSKSPADNTKPAPVVPAGLITFMDGLTPVYVRPEAIDSIHHVQPPNPNGDETFSVQLRGGAKLLVTGVSEDQLEHVLAAMAK